ncbi:MULTISPECIES: AfsR/SARP family transcriptional regulator [unclassified Streptomyces]|uniref:AfsR/SARP family transcriptional regulator n=1 Tax=unclassified Streptomyces TaxID=2593676 RepID=UPI00036E28C1|nr:MULTISPECIES: AfsR/SARP family transcriptional regulator [unclassified Streptomyces]MYT28604.1 helix-turn-helix domain-containing protein [Streptomyces sp. SID8354]
MAETSALSGSDRIRLLGPVRYVSARGNVTRPGAPGPQSVLAALALRPGTLVTIDELIDGLYFDDPPASARRVIVNYIHRLRTHLDREARAAQPGDGGDGPGRAVIETMADGYVLRIPEDRVDALRFGQLVALARRHAHGRDPAAGAACLEEALAMWQGPALAGLPGPFALNWRRTLGEQLASALEYRLELLLVCGRHAEAVPDIVRALKTYPYRERLHGALMLALYRSGRAAEALSAYDRARRVLAEDLGIDTSPTLRTLHAAILAGDEALLLPSDQGDEDDVEDEAGQGDEGAASAAEAARAGAPAPVGPGQLPPAPCDFTGRQEQMSALVSALTSGQAHAVAVVTGMGGAGKTALALRAAHAVAGTYPDGQLYANLRAPDGAPADPGEVLAGFLTGLGVPAERIPGSLPERAALFRTVLSPRAVLVVLDNAATAAQIEPLLPGAARCAVLITGRTLPALPATVTLPLRGLGADEAVELIGKVAGVHRIQAEPDAVAALVAACGHLPLALRAAGARLAARPGWSVAALLERVSDQARLLAELRVGEVTVEAVFEMSFAQLSARQAAAFLALSVPHCTEFDVRAAAAALRMPEQEAEDVLEALVDAALLETGAPGRYHFHDLVGAYARQKARSELPASEHRAVVRGAIDYLCTGVVAAVRATQPLSGPLTAEIHPRRTADLDMSGGPEAVRWIRRVLPVLGAVVEQVAADGDPEAVALAVDALTLVPCFEEVLPLGSLGRAASVLLPAALAHCGPAVVGTAYYAAGTILRKHAGAGSLQRAREHLRRVVEIFGDAPRPGEGQRPFLAVLFTHTMLAQLEVEFGGFEAARWYAQRSVELAATTGDQALVARRRTLLLQIEVLDPDRRTDLAAIGAQCRELAGVLTRGQDVKWLISVMMTEADSLLYDGRHTAAVGLYQRVLARARSTDHVRNVTECQFRLAEAMLLAGDADAAVAYAWEALAGAQESCEQRLLARSHQVLGEALRAVGRGSEADDHLARATELERELRPDGPRAVTAAA